MNNLVVDDQMVLLSQYYPDLYTQLEPQKEVKQRRRRRKVKEENCISGGTGFKKRKLTDEQVNLLEISFENEHKLDSERKDRLAAELGLDPRQVAVWFQNRRARWKSKKTEEEVSKLKKENEAFVLDKCRMATEMGKIKKELTEAQKEILDMKKLLERVDGVSINSPSSSFSMETMGPPTSYYDDFGMEGIGNGFYSVSQYNYGSGFGMDQWNVNLI